MRSSRPETTIPESRDRDALLPLLDTKLLPPEPPVQFVPRPRLVSQVSRAVESAPLTVICAPAGSGKTILAATWAAEPGVTMPVAWLRLDETDCQPGVFWSYVLAALSRHGVVSSHTDRPTHADAVDPSFITRLAADLLALDEPVVLVLDEMERLKGDQVPKELDLLLRCAAPRFRLVVATRTDPLLPLHRYRLAGSLAEIRLDDLAFTAAEVTCMLEAHGVHSPGLAAEVVLKRTEGWAAGVRLASMALQCTAPSTSLADELSACLGPKDSVLAEYLVAEVMQALPPDVRQFLLCTSVAAELRPGLAGELSGRADADHVLAELAHGNAFVSQVHGAPGQYRVHPLFRELLGALLAHESPHELPRLHERAAHWFAARGEIAHAVEHDVSAGDWPAAARLVVESLAIGQLALLPASTSRTVGILAALPDDVATPEAWVVRAAALVARGDLPDARRSLERVAAVAADTSAALRAAVEVTGTALLAASGAAEGTLAAAARAQHALAQLPAADVVEHPELRAIVLAAAGASSLRVGDLHGACVQLSDALMAGAAPGCEGLRLQALARLALAEASRGRLSRAEELAASADALADSSAVVTPRRPSAGALAHAWVAIERQDLRAARRWLARADDVGETCSDVLLASVSTLLRLRLRLDVGDLDGARSLLSEAEIPIPWLRAAAVAETAILDLASGRRALAELTPTELIEDDEQPLDVRVHNLMERAQWHLAHADDRAGTSALLRALRLSEPQAMRRPFVHVPAQVRRLIRTDPSVSARAEWLDPARAAGAKRAQTLAPVDATVILQPLSRKETEVLTLLAALLTTEEIAGKLFISVNTVKTHIRSILRKLSVSRRNEAIRRARELQII